MPTSLPKACRNGLPKFCARLTGQHLMTPRNAHGLSLSHEETAGNKPTPRGRMLPGVAGRIGSHAEKAMPAEPGVRAVKLTIRKASVQKNIIPVFSIA